MKHISIYACIKQAWAFLLANFRSLQAYIIPFLITIVVLSILSQTLISHDNEALLRSIQHLDGKAENHPSLNPKNLLTALGFLIVGLMIRMPVFAALSRKIILAKTPASNLFARVLTGRELRMLGNLALCYLSIFLVTLVTGFILGFSATILALVTKVTLSEYMVGMIVISLIVFGIMFLAWFAARLGLVLPMSAIDQRKTLRTSFTATNGNANKFFGLNFLLKWVPVILYIPIALVFPNNYIATAIAVAILGYFELIWISSISFAYNQLKA
jgi:hypothetical protein